MTVVKKSLNIDESIIKDIDLIIENNPEMNFTAIANQALKAWVENPVLILARPRKVTAEDIDKMMDEDKELLEDLSK